MVINYVADITVKNYKINCGQMPIGEVNERSVPAGTVAADTGTPRPAARAIPGPGAAPGMGTRGRPSSGGGGPSTVRETIFSPRSRTKPSTRFSSLSTARDTFDLTRLNSSQSPNIRFMCLSNAAGIRVLMKQNIKIQEGVSSGS
jgi:hypothetical protein